MSSKLLFKFNNFHEARGCLFPDVCSDVTTKADEWKVCHQPTIISRLLSRNTFRNAANAEDHGGNLWGIKLSVDNFFIPNTREVNPIVDACQYKLYPIKIETCKSRVKVARSLGYSVKSRITVTVRDNSGGNSKKESTRQTQVAALELMKMIVSLLTGPVRDRFSKITPSSLKW